MPLNKCRIGDCVQLYTERCGRPNVSPSEISGVDKNKLFFEPAQQVGDNTSNYKIVPPGFFACNLMHVGRDKVLPIARNRTKKSKIVSPAYTVFRIKEDSLLLPEFLFMFVNSSEKDRYFWFHCDSSIRDGMDWATFCNIRIEVPDKIIQEKYVKVFCNLSELQDSIKKGLRDLILICNNAVGQLRRTTQVKLLGQYITQLQDTNLNMTYGKNSVVGLSTQKEIIKTKADLKGVGLSGYKLFPPRSFAYVPDTSRRGEKISLAFNDTTETLLVSSISVVFCVKNENDLCPEFLFMFFSQNEFDRYARFNSWGSARETFAFEDMGRTPIPLPKIDIQRSYAAIFTCLKSRQVLSQRLSKLSNNICPILIDKAIKEASL